MVSAALNFLMTATANLTPNVLYPIFTKARKSTHGSETDRLWQATSWTDLLRQGKGIATSSAASHWKSSSWTDLLWNTPLTVASTAISVARHPLTSLATAKSTVRESFRTLPQDPDLPKFLENNSALMSCMLNHMLREPDVQRIDAFRELPFSDELDITTLPPSRSIEIFVGHLPKLVETLQKRGCLKNATNLNDVLITVFDTVIKDATSASDQSLYSTSLEASQAFLDMIAEHPVAAQKLIERFTVSTKSPAHQEAMLKALESRKHSDKTPKKKGPDGISRHDFSVLCSKFREEEDPYKRMFFDTALEDFMHRCDCSSLSLTAATIAPNMHIEDFIFRNAKLYKGFPTSGSCLIGCDFSFASIDDGVSFDGCIMDARTFATLVPSLRVAQAEGKTVSLSGLTIHGDLSGIDLSHIDLKSTKVSKAPKTQATSTALNPREVETRRVISDFVKQTWGPIPKDVTPAAGSWWDYVPFSGGSGNKEPTRAQLFEAASNAMYHRISELSDAEQSVVLYTLNHSPELSERFAKQSTEEKDIQQTFISCVEAVQANPEYERKYLRETKEEDLDPFTSTFLNNLPSVTDTEHAVLTTIAQEHVKSLSRMYDGYEGSPKEKSALLLQKIKTDPQFKFHKKVVEYQHKVHYFTEQHMESMRFLFTEVACGPLLDTVEYESETKNPPQRFGTAFQKTLCFLCPNLRPLFGVNTKFGKVIASRSFLQICRLIKYIILHPQKMSRVLKHTGYVMDQLGWITWKEPRDIAAAQNELLTKLVTKGIAGSVLEHPRLPSLLFSITYAFSDKTHATKTLEVGIKFYTALEETGVVKKFGVILRGPAISRTKAMVPFLRKIIDNGMLRDINDETIDVFTSAINKALHTAPGNSPIQQEEVKKLADTANKLSDLLKKHKISDNLEAILLASEAERVELLKKVIHDPTDLTEIIRAAQEIQTTAQPIVVKVAEQWTTPPVEKKGVMLWYQPDQVKVDKLMATKRTDPNAPVDFNKEFNACSFGNSALIGTETAPLNWTNIRAQKFDMWGTTLTHVNLDGSRFTGYTNPIKSKFYFRGASFDHAKMTHCTLNRVDLAHAYMQEIQIQLCKADGAVISDSDMKYAAIVDSTLSNTSFRESKFYGAYITDCVLTKVDFSKTECVHTVFKSSFRENTTFEGADLSNTTFLNSEFSGHINMRETILIGTQLENIRLADGATLNIEGAVLSEGLLAQLQNKFKSQLQNADKAITVPEETVKTLSVMTPSKRKTELPNIGAQRVQKQLKGKFTNK